MTQLVHDAALMKVPVDTSRLFDGDAMYAAWILAIVERVNETKAEINERERAEMKAAQAAKQGGK